MASEINEYITMQEENARLKKNAAEKGLNEIKKTCLGNKNGEVDKIYCSLQAVSKFGLANKKYKKFSELFNELDHSDFLKIFLQDLMNNKKYKVKYNGSMSNMQNFDSSKLHCGCSGKLEGKFNFMKENIIKPLSKLIKDNGGASKGGSKKKGSKVKGKRILKNGTVAGYVRQKDGSYKWRFLKRR